MKYRIDSDKFAVVSAFETRGFTRVYDDSYDIYWAPISAVQPFFRAHSKALFSHFPAFHEMTRKDLLYSHIKSYKKANPAMFSSFPLIPSTFQLPHESPLLAREALEAKHSIFPLILKPAGRSEGRGIVIISSLESYRIWTSEHANELYIASKYISNPLKIEGRKFDLRIYVLVQSFVPLEAYIYEEAFCRFCADVYSNDFNDLQAHLTNVAINQPFDTGTKMSMESLLLFLRARYTPGLVHGLQGRISRLVALTLFSVEKYIGYAKNAFELYGFDVLLDDNLLPWLMEVNACPSLSVSSDADRVLKCALIDDVFRVILKEGGTGDFTPLLV